MNENLKKFCEFRKLEEEIRNIYVNVCDFYDKSALYNYVLKTVVVYLFLHGFVSNN